MIFQKLKNINFNIFKNNLNQQKKTQVGPRFLLFITIHLKSQKSYPNFYNKKIIELK